MSASIAKKKKPIPCRFWLQGKCRNGDSCEYIHSMDVPESLQTSANSSEPGSKLNSNATGYKKIVLSYAISPQMFGVGVVSHNVSSGLLFDAILPEDFFLENESSYLKYANKDLQMLLKMPFNHFMSHLLCDENLAVFLSSFFAYSPRIYDAKKPSSFLSDLYMNVLRVYVRILMDEKGQKDFQALTPPFGGFGKTYFEALFSRKLLSVYCMMDLCCIYGESNSSVLSEMMNHLLSYYSPFKDLLYGLFVDCGKKIEITVAMIREETIESKKSDYETFVTDALNCMQRMILVYPDSCYYIFDDIHNLLFQSYIKQVLKELHSIVSSSTKTLILQLMDTACNEMIYQFFDGRREEMDYDYESTQELLFTYIRSNYEKNKDDDMDSHYIYSFLASRLSQLYKMDPIQASYFIQLLNSSSLSFDALFSRLTAKQQRAEASNQQMTKEQLSFELLSEMFPDYGKAFIKAIIQHYGLNKNDEEREMEKVVNAIMNNELPRELRCLNQKANTMKELYNVSQKEKDEEEKKRVFEGLFTSDELKRIERSSNNQNNEENAAIDPSLKAKILADYKNSVYEDEDVDESFFEGIRNTNHDGVFVDDEESMEKEKEEPIVSKEESEKKAEEKKRIRSEKQVDRLKKNWNKEKKKYDRLTEHAKEQKQIHDTKKKEEKKVALNEKKGK